MRTRLLFCIITFAISCTIMGQEIMYIEYKNGKSVKEELDNVAKISFHHLDELPAEPVLTDISRGLISYYTFDNETVNDTQNRHNGFLSNGTFITDTPCGDGRALFLKRGESVFIPYSPFNEKRNYTISFWVKDFCSGALVKTYGNNYLYGPTVLVTEGMKIEYHSGSSSYGDNFQFNTDLSNIQNEKWSMITVVTSSENNSNQGTCTLYINGVLMETCNSYTMRNSGSTSMGIGGYTNSWADPMKIDNLRLYNVALTQEEIKTIYEKELHPSVINVTPKKLYFDKNTDKQTITIGNQSLHLVDFSINSKVENLSISTINSFISAKESKSIEISINDRDKVNNFTSGSIIVESEGMYYSIDVQIEKGISASPVSEEVPRGLQAYYKFDNENIDDSRNGYNGILEEGMYITDTPNGSGKAIFLKKSEYAKIPYAPLDGKSNYTISLWVKDFGAGTLFSCNNNYLFGPTLYVTESMKLSVYTGSSSYGDQYQFDTSLSNFQSEKWTMVTVVTTTTGSNSQGTVKLYINGHRVNTGTSYTKRNSGAISMCIGSRNSDPMKIDNIRLYSVSLTDEEVMEIYNVERK